MNKPLTIELTSFSFKRSLPPHMFSNEDGRHGGGFVFDCRSLPNPGREERYKLATGLDTDVKTYLAASPHVLAFKDSVSALVFSAVDNFLERGFEFMNFSFGCTGGQHRSVFFADEIGKMLRERYGERIKVVTIHSSLAEKGLLPADFSSCPS